ncbi:MAG TPA: hypothetical protein VK427_08175 [Kofleriaceae bacterium]|nr:hypothetical protein [Kofleriaceae bacterium]
MSTIPGRDAESLYTRGAARALYEQMCLAANDDPRTALALVQGCFVEMTINLVHAEVPSAHHHTALATFLGMASERLRELASVYARKATPTSPQDEGAALAKSLRARFETTAVTRTPCEWDARVDDDV